MKRYRPKQLEHSNVNYTIVAIAMCQEHADGKCRVAGKIICPKCSGELNYSIASNGHVWGVCKTKGCLRWMM